VLIKTDVQGGPHRCICGGRQASLRLVPALSNNNGHLNSHMLLFADDNETLCRTYGNLAAMFFMRRCYRLSLRCRRAELFYCLSSSLGDRRARLLTVMSNLGHALRATGHHSGAILCHRLCAVSAERSADGLAAARELRNVGKDGAE